MRDPERKLKDEYRARKSELDWSDAISLGFDGAWVKQQLDDQVPEEVDGRLVKSVFLGTVFALTPSGKYYQPFACSNVEPCPLCDGAGHLQTTHKCKYCEGGLISYSAIAKRCHETVEQCRDRMRQVWPDRQHDDDHAKCHVCDGAGRVPIECPYCHGIGSREAYLDEQWQEAADSTAEFYGFSIESGEGDPCDIFAVQYRDLGEEGDDAADS